MTTTPTYACGHCGRRLTAEKMVFSSHTGSRYCGVDLGRCEREGAKRVRRAKRERSASAV